MKNENPFVNEFISLAPEQRRLFLAEMAVNGDAHTRELHRVLSELHQRLISIE